jgi:hypothetical protein
LPAASLLKNAYVEGVPIGYFRESTKETVIYNHLEITVFIQHTVESHQRIVGFEIIPYSIGEGPERAFNLLADKVYP